MPAGTLVTCITDSVVLRRRSAIACSYRQLVLADESLIVSTSEWSYSSMTLRKAHVISLKDDRPVATRLFGVHDCVCQSIK